MPRDTDRSKQAFVDLHDRMAKRLLAYLVRRMLDRDAATELWAETWATAFENWTRCRARTDAETEGWVFGIARHQLAAYYRTGSIEHRALERLHWSIPAADAAIDDELERIVERDALRLAFAGALETLPPMRREAVRLRIIDGLSYADVARALGCSQQAARAHVSRGLKRLGDAIDRYELTALEVTAR